MEYERFTNTNTQSEPTLAELLSRLSDQAGTLVRQEIQLAQTEMTRKATRAGKNAALVVGGAIVGLGAFYSLIAALILVLAQAMDAWLAALLVAVLLAVVAGVLVWIGVNKLKAIDPTPRRTIETMRENKEWLAQQI